MTKTFLMIIVVILGYFPLAGFVCAESTDYRNELNGGENAGNYSEALITTASDQSNGVSISFDNEIKIDENRATSNAFVEIKKAREANFSSAKTVTNISRLHTDDTSYSYAWGWNEIQSSSKADEPQASTRTAKSATEVTYKKLPNSREIFFRTAGKSKSDSNGRVSGTAEGGSGSGYFRNNIEVRTRNYGKSTKSGTGNYGTLNVDGHSVSGISGTWENPRANANSFNHSANSIETQGN